MNTLSETYLTPTRCAGKFALNGLSCKRLYDDLVAAAAPALMKRRNKSMRTDKTQNQLCAESVTLLNKMQKQPHNEPRDVTILWISVRTLPSVSISCAGPPGIRVTEEPESGVYVCGAPGADKPEGRLSGAGTRVAVKPGGIEGRNKGAKEKAKEGGTERGKEGRDDAEGGHFLRSRAKRLSAVPCDDGGSLLL